ncbi:MAG TPA: hypothetical protein VFP68_21790 [Burkholderiaceae bacterium]|nr:hypothetical protein [Burkholderiaceae bacterium]
MTSLQKIVSAVTAALGLCGVCMAQSGGGAGASGVGSGTMTPDNSGSTVTTPPSTMPAEVVPPSVSGSRGGSGSTTDSGSATSSSNSVIPTRDEVKAETRALVRRQAIPHGELSTVHQDRGGVEGSSPNMTGTGR